MNSYADKPQAIGMVLIYIQNQTHQKASTLTSVSQII